jgi:mycofactocin precursor
MENPVDSIVEPSSAPVAETDDQATAVIEAELLIEEISIDGMCGVY